LPIAFGSISIMMRTLGGKQFARPELATRAHRLMGWSYAVLYLTQLVVMVGWPARIAIHVVLGVG